MEKEREENKIIKTIDNHGVELLIVKNNRDKYKLIEPAYEHKVRSYKIHKEDDIEDIVAKLDETSKEYEICHNDNNFNPQLMVEILEDEDTLKNPEHNSKFWNVVESVKKKIKEYKPEIKKAVTVATLALGLVGTSSMFALSSPDTLNKSNTKYDFSKFIDEDADESVKTTHDAEINTLIKTFNQQIRERDPSKEINQQIRNYYGINRNQVNFFNDVDDENVIKNDDNAIENNEDEVTVVDNLSTEEEASLNTSKKQEIETSQSEDEIKNAESVIENTEDVIKNEEDVTKIKETVIENTEDVMEEHQSEDKGENEININNAPISHENHKDKINKVQTFFTASSDSKERDNETEPPKEKDKVLDPNKKPLIKEEIEINNSPISHENPINKINKVQTVFTAPSNKERYDEALPPKEKDKILDPNKNPLGEELNKQKNINENLKKEIEELKKEIENIKKPEFIKNLGSKEEVIQKLYSFLKEKNIDININELDAYNPEDFGSEKNNYQHFFLNYSNCKLSRAELITTLFQFQPIDGVLFDWNPIEKETYGTNKNYYEQLVKSANEKKEKEQLKDKLAVAYTVGSSVPKFTLLKNFITGEKQEYEGYKYNGLRLDGEGNEKVVLSKQEKEEEILLEKKEYENIIKQNEALIEENKSEEVFYLHKFDRNKAYTVGAIVPNFGKLLDQSTGKTKVYEGYTFSKYIKDPERRDWKDQVLLVKNNKDGSKSELLISQQEYENILKATEQLNRELERIEADSYEWMIAHQEYDKRLNLDENKLRVNTPKNFIHNIRIGIKMKAQNPNDVFDIAKNFVDQMTEKSRKEFIKMRNDCGAEKFDNMLLNEFYSHVEDIKKEELQFGSQENDEVFKQFYGEYEKGYYIGNTGKVIGDEIPISICIENLDGKKMKTPKTNFEIVKASKGRHPNTVLLYSKEYKTAYEIPLADLTEHIQKIEKEERKEEKNRKDKKYEMHLDR